MKKNGFTLVEMLVVISILSVAGVMILTIFTRTLRGGNKSQIIGAIKQNGQSVLETMDKTVRNSDDVVCPTVVDACMTTPPCKNLVVRSGGIYIRYRFIDPLPSISPTANGFIQKDNPVKEIDPATSKEYTDPAFVNKICSAADTMPEAVILTDTKTQTGVSVENGLFERNRSAGFADQVTIKFDLRPGIEAPQAVAGQIDPVSFQTTIQLR